MGKIPARDEPSPSVRGSQTADERLDLRIAQAFRRIIRAIDLHSHKLAAAHRITGPQLLCLNYIVDQVSTTATVLAGHLHLSPSTVVGILDRLEQKGLILRERDGRDRRVVRVTATPQGREVVKLAPSPLQDTLARALNQLSDLERTAIALSLERVVDLMAASGIEAAPVLETGPIDVDVEPPARGPSA